MEILRTVVLAALITAIVLVVARQLRTRTRVPTTVLAVAGAFYLLNLVVQAPLLLLARQIGFAPAVLAGLVLPVVYGLVEELARYASFGAGATMRAHRTGPGALMAGLGHGGAEAVVLAALYGIADGGWADLALFAVGRLCAIAVHVGFATLVVLARRRSRWLLGVAVLLHITVDASTFAAQGVVGSWSLVLFALWAAVAGALVLAVRRRDLAAGPGAAVRTNAAVPA